ncbi:MAG: NUDIX domain-containing protein [Sandaracinaceae bacterium]
MSDALEGRPRVEVEVLADDPDARCDRGFLTLRRLTLRHRWADGVESPAYPYDVVERAATDAVAIVLLSEGAIALRSSIRPPLAFRAGYALPLAGASDPVLWEVPAGLVEASETGDEGLRRCAARETLEEVGLPLEASAFERLGPPSFMSPGVLAEQLHFYVAEVDRSRVGTPTEDGSPLEARAAVRFVDLDEALAACRDGRVEDLKTETAIRRALEWSAR